MLNLTFCNSAMKNQHACRVFFVPKEMAHDDSKSSQHCVRGGRGNEDDGGKLLVSKRQATNTCDSLVAFFLSLEGFRFASQHPVLQVSTASVLQASTPFCKSAPRSCDRTTQTGSAMQASIACEHTRAHYRSRLTSILRMCEWIDKTPFATCSPSNGSTKTRSLRTAVRNHQRIYFRIAVGGERVFVASFDGEQVANGVLSSNLHFHDYDVNNWAKQRPC